MKYINKFPTNADYQAFTEGGDVTPNICYVEETKGLVIKPKINNGGSDITTLFPCYLTGSITLSGIIDNGEIGKQLYNYLHNNYSYGTWSLASDEKIYVNSTIVNEITISNNYSNIVLGKYISMDYELTSNGQVYNPDHNGSVN